MQKLSNVNNVFVFHGQTIPFEFKDICEKAWEIPKYRKKIENRGYISRNYLLFKRFLSKVYGGDLPKDVYKLTQKLKYESELQDLFYDNMGEEGYKNYHPDYYNSFYNDLSEKEKLSVFWRCDCGGRSVYEYMQDVIAGNIYEDMLVYHSKNILTANEKASGRGSSKVSTLCDLVFRSPKKEGYPYVEANVEVKSKYIKTIKDSFEVRGSAKKIIDSDGIVMCVYPIFSKAILVDMGRDQEISRGVMSGGKDCDVIKVNPDDFFDFKCWEKADMTNMLHMIYEMRRETK